MKKLLMGTAALALIVVAAVFLLVGNIDSIIHEALEEVGSELLGTQVSVASVDIDLKVGAGRISGISIANPAGFSSEDAFQMDEIRLELQVGSLAKQPLIVNELKIRDPVVRVEAKEDGSVNLKTLLDNIEKNREKANRKAAEKSRSNNAPKGDPVRISFGLLSVTGVKVHASIPRREPETVVVPDIVMKNVGQGPGLTPAGIGKVIMGEIIASSLKATLQKSITEKVKEAAKGFMGDLKDKLDSE